jgi:hypothetical protein
MELNQQIKITSSDRLTSCMRSKDLHALHGMPAAFLTQNGL